MAECRNCRMLKENTCLAHPIAASLLSRPIPPAPSGACMIPIVNDYLEMIKPGMKVLEIGCGTWDWIKKRCESVGATYEAIDTEKEYYGIKTIATRLENLAELSYSDKEFDLVIGNQTMEHWGQFGCTIEWGLYQCFRVTKLGGRVMMNVPIHFHGTEEFLAGKIDKIQQAFQHFSGQVKSEKWGNPSDPIPAFYPHPGYLFLADKPAYVLNVEAYKDRETNRIVSNRYGTSGRLSQILNLPLSYNWYRIKKKLGLVRLGK